MQSFVSVRMLLLVASMVVLGVSIFLIQNNSHSRQGGDDYIRRRMFKTVGYTLLFPALLLLGLATLSEQMSSDSSVTPIDPVAAAVAQAYVPPVLPKVTENLLVPKDTWKTRLPSTNGTSYDSAPSQLVHTSVPSDSSVPLSPAQKIDAQLMALTARIQTNPKDLDALGQRGNIYAGQRSWDDAEHDYESILAIDSTNTKAAFNLSEMSFMQKKFDVAKAGFLALKQDPDLGDLAAYKVFLCDLFSNQDDAASKELDAFNQVGANASFYFANAAWSIRHRKTDDARNWLRSATRIYPPEKFRLYATTLYEMGYLPLPPSPQN